MQRRYGYGIAVQVSGVMALATCAIKQRVSIGAATLVPVIMK